MADSGINGAKNGTKERDAKGRFTKGNHASPGRKPRATEEEYQDAFYSVVTIERFKRMVEAQARRAEKGDIQAFNAIANRVIPIIEKRELSGTNGEPIRITGVDYRTSIANLAPGPVEDSEAPGEDQNTFDGPEMG